MKMKMDVVKGSVLLAAAISISIVIGTGFDMGRAIPLVPIGLFVGAFPYFIYRYLRYTKVKAMEDAFPEFLRNLSESQKSGITFTQAIITASKIDYGALSDEIKKMAAQISWGIPLPRVLEKFSERVRDSDFLRRSTAIILEAYRSGGDVAEVMESVAESARLVKELEAERKSRFNQQLLIMYAIYIIFLVIIVALNKILLPMFALSSSEDIGGMGLTMGNLDPNFYRTTFLHMILMQAVFAGLIAGQVGEGSVIAGIKHSAVMLALGSLVFVLFIPAQQVVISVEESYDVFAPGSIYTLKGTAMKSDRTPLSGAEVTAELNGLIRRTKTDALGEFTLEFILPQQSGTYRLKIGVEHAEGKGKKTVEVRVG